MDVYKLVNIRKENKYFTIKIFENEHHLMVMEGLRKDVSVVAQPSEAIDDHPKRGIKH